MGMILFQHSAPSEHFRLVRLSHVFGSPSRLPILRNYMPPSPQEGIPTFYVRIMRGPVGLLRVPPRHGQEVAKVRCSRPARSILWRLFMARSRLGFRQMADQPSLTCITAGTSTMTCMPSPSPLTTRIPFTQVRMEGFT